MCVVTLWTECGPALVYVPARLRSVRPRHLRRRLQPHARDAAARGQPRRREPAREGDGVKATVRRSATTRATRPQETGVTGARGSAHFRGVSS